VELKLDEEDAEALLYVLNSYLSDLRYEIADTDRSTFREQLRRHREKIERILAALEAAGVKGEPSSS
jgi:acetolactate synthase small subunit